MNKVFDCFTFFDETDLLSIRLHTLNDVVDQFVLVESTITQAGTKKDLVYDKVKNDPEFAPFKDKITHIIVDDPPSAKPMSHNTKTSPRWENEGHQRDCISRGLRDIDDTDLIFISDVDEIINPLIVPQLAPLRGPFWPIQNFYYYFMDCKLNHSDNISFCCRKEHLDAHKNITDLKNNRRFMFRPRMHGGWHFSYLMSPSRIQQKIQLMADSHFSREEIWNLGHIKHCVESPCDLFGRQHKNPAYNMKIVQNTNTLPKYILDNMDKYQKYFYPGSV